MLLSFKFKFAFLKFLHFPTIYFQPELYKEELLARQSSVESSSTDAAEKVGKLHFSLRYDSELEALVVKVSKTEMIY